MMRVLGLIGIAVAVIGGGMPRAAAQSTADSYFHEGAQQYVAGNTEAARRAVEKGLEVAPADPRLVALRKKLQQKGRPEGQQDSSSTASNEQSQENGDRSSDEASGGEENSSSADTGGGLSGPHNESGRSDRPRSSGAPAPASGQADTMRRGGAGRPVDTLSRAQAERLLRALEGQERRLLRRIRTRASERHRRVEKDW